MLTAQLILSCQNPRQLQRLTIVKVTSLVIKKASGQLQVALMFEEAGVSTETETAYYQHYVAGSDVPGNVKLLVKID